MGEAPAGTGDKYKRVFEIGERGSKPVKLMLILKRLLTNDQLENIIWKNPMDPEPTILDLIDAYLKDVKEVATIFHVKFGRTDLLRASIDGTIPRKGENLGKIRTYSFHGNGLYARMGQREVDFDFGKNDSITAFDSWRLWRYAKNNETLYNEYQTEGAIVQELGILELQQKVYRQDGQYYLAD